MSDVNKVWFAEYARAEKEMAGQEPSAVHKYALHRANEVRRKYLRKKHGKFD